MRKPRLSLALDLDLGVIYWSFLDSIERVDLALLGEVGTLVSGLAGSSRLNGVNGLVLGVVSPIPEPSTALMLTLGLVGIAVGRRRTAERSR
jgi:hypothetical protein